MDIADYLKKEQVDSILEAARLSNERDYLMLRVMWRTGMRVSELLNLKLEDIEPDCGAVNITNGKGKKQNGHVDIGAALRTMEKYARFAANDPE